MEKLKLTIIILAGLLVIACCYIITTKVDFCGIEIAKNDSYYSGFNEGRESWNLEVIYGVNNFNVIPYWFNQTYYVLNISQRCKNQNVN